jgi:hypothetical protein
VCSSDLVSVGVHVWNVMSVSDHVQRDVSVGVHVWNVMSVSDHVRKCVPVSDGILNNVRSFYTMCIAANCSWPFVYCVIILCVSLLPHVYCFTVCVYCCLTYFSCQTAG